MIIIQQIYQLFFADHVGLAVRTECHRYFGGIDIRHLDTAVQLADIIAVGHCAFASDTSSTLATHSSEVIAVGHVAIARNAARLIFIITACTSDTPVVIAVCCSSASDNTAGIYVFLGRSRSVYTAGIPAEICCTADLSGDTTNVTIPAINVLYGYRSFI